MYDLVGDIHGHADELRQLLEMLGYRQHHGRYQHAVRKVIFLGDFIDRGPQIRETLRIVRSMVESGTAMSVIGNHELNAISYHTENPEHPGEFLRRHTSNNNLQISRTIQQLPHEELLSYLDWFRSLPLWLDLEGLRVVHACWDPIAISKIAPVLTAHNGLSKTMMQDFVGPEKSLFDPIEIVLKGKEAKLPEGVVLSDSDGHIRKRARVRWYLPAKGQTFRTYTLTRPIDSDLPVESSLVEQVVPYAADECPVFIGHYSMLRDAPETLAPNVACLDYGIIRGGFLCAYRWDGEQRLSNDKFVWTRKS